MKSSENQAVFGNLDLNLKSLRQAMQPVSVFCRNLVVCCGYLIEKERYPNAYYYRHHQSRIILPKSFFSELDKMNRILADGGVSEKLTAETYVRKEFDKAMKETMLRAEDKVIK